MKELLPAEWFPTSSTDSFSAGTSSLEFTREAKLTRPTRCG
jgi:hypothetical protein